MRCADVRKLLENVGVRFQTGGRAFALGEEREAVIDHVVSEDAAVGIVRRLLRIENHGRRLNAWPESCTTRAPCRSVMRATRQSTTPVASPDTRRLRPLRS